MTTGMVIGIVVGVVALLAIAGVAIWVVRNGTDVKSWPKK